MSETQKGEATAAGLKELKERLGAVFDEIFALGRQAGRDEGYKAGLAEGARVERERLATVLTQAPPDPGAPAGAPSPASAGGGNQAAQHVLAAEAAKAGGAISKITKVLATETAKAAGRLFEGRDEKGHQPLPAARDSEELASEALGLSLEARCKAEWEREPRLQAEYGTLEAYTEFVRQRGQGTAPIL